MKKFLLAFLCLSYTVISFAQDTLHVISHNKVVVQTDPSTGFVDYPARVVFPSANTSYRTILLNVTMQCPDNLMCGEWDYSDGIFLINKHKNICEKDTIEISRILTPYGRFYGPDWKFTFSADITDFTPLLHDSLTVFYRHTGYEARDDRGWKITLDFAITTGPAVADCYRIIPAWNGNFKYGDILRSIEQDLKPVVYKPTTDGFSRLWIIQTGHGMDLNENCAEFCYKYRDVLFDEKLNNRRLIKKECASNPLYHQAGTWIYDRANWCPGDMVQPECYNYALRKNTNHSVDINMQPYVIDSGEVTACYSFSSYLFLYGKIKKKIDASLMKIISPGSDALYAPVNPDFTQIKFLVKNNGSDTIHSLSILYYFEGDVLKMYNWKGVIPFGMQDTIVIHDEVFPLNQTKIFYINILKVNGKDDQYSVDNGSNSMMPEFPVYPQQMILSYHTNLDTNQTSWQIKDSKGKIIYQKGNMELGINQFYNDTIALHPGFYTLTVSDTAGDGLEFWANPEGGMGYFRMKSLDGKIIKVFQSDFGNSIHQAFQVSDDKSKLNFSEEDQLFAYPQRTTKFTNLYFLLNQPADVHYKLLKGDAVLFEKTLMNVGEAKEYLDLSGYAAGIYQVQLDWSGQSKKIRIKIVDKQ
jgi:hypothetical protein